MPTDPPTFQGCLLFVTGTPASRENNPFGVLITAPRGTQSRGNLLHLPGCALRPVLPTELCGPPPPPPPPPAAGRSRMNQCRLSNVVVAVETLTGTAVLETPLLSAAGLVRCDRRVYYETVTNLPSHTLPWVGDPCH